MNNHAKPVSIEGVGWPLITKDKLCQVRFARGPSLGVTVETVNVLNH